MQSPSDKHCPSKPERAEQVMTAQVLWRQRWGWGGGYSYNRSLTPFSNVPILSSKKAGCCFNGQLGPLKFPIALAPFLIVTIEQYIKPVGYVYIMLAPTMSPQIIKIFGANYIWSRRVPTPRLRITGGQENEEIRQGRETTATLKGESAKIVQNRPTTFGQSVCNMKGLCSTRDTFTPAPCNGRQEIEKVRVKLVKTQP